MLNLSYRRAPWLLVPMFCLFFAGTAPSASFSLTTTTSFKVAGWLGKVLSKVGPNEITKNIAVSGDYLLESDENGDRIISLPDSQIITINHARKNYHVMPFSFYRNLLRGGTTSDDGGDDQGQPTHEIRVDYSLDRPGEFKDFGERRTERFIETVTAEMLPIDENGTVAERGEKLVLVFDKYLTEDPIPGFTVLHDFHQRFSEALGAAVVGEGMLERIKQAIGDDPRFQQALQRAAEANQQKTGSSVMTTMYLVKVPAPLDYDDKLVFGEKEKKKKGGLGRFAKKLAQQAAGQATGIDIGEQKEEKPQEQRTILSTTEMHSNFSTAPVDILAKMPPEEYTEINYGASN